MGTVSIPVTFCLIMEARNNVSLTVTMRYGAYKTLFCLPLNTSRQFPSVVHEYFWLTCSSYPLNDNKHLLSFTPKLARAETHAIERKQQPVKLWRDGRGHCTVHLQASQRGAL